MNVERFFNKIKRVSNNEEFYNKFALNLMNNNAFHLKNLLYSTCMNNMLKYILMYLADVKTITREKLIYLKNCIRFVLFQFIFIRIQKIKKFNSTKQHCQDFGENMKMILI